MGLLHLLEQYNEQLIYSLPNIRLFRGNDYPLRNIDSRVEFAQGLDQLANGVAAILLAVEDVGVVE